MRTRPTLPIVLKFVCFDYCVYCLLVTVFCLLFTVFAVLLCLLFIVYCVFIVCCLLWVAISWGFPVYRLLFCYCYCFYNYCLLCVVQCSIRVAISWGFPVYRPGSPLAHWVATVLQTFEHLQFEHLHVFTRTDICTYIFVCNWILSKIFWTRSSGELLPPRKMYVWVWNRSSELQWQCQWLSPYFR